MSDVTSTFATDRLEAARDCLIAAGELTSKDVVTAERFNHRAYQLVTAALLSLKGEEDPQAGEPIY